MDYAALSLNSSKTEYKFIVSKCWLCEGESEAVKVIETNTTAINNNTFECSKCQVRWKGGGYEQVETTVCEVQSKSKASKSN